MPALFSRLCEAPALQFLILTAARSGEVRGATWAEVDLAGRVWTIPAEHMKSEREHRVPLSAPAIDLLHPLDDTLLFPSRRLDVPATVHGFRSSFRDWAAEQTNHPREVAEMALAHTIGDKVEAAYRRADLFEKRRLLMADWTRFCG